MKKNKTLFLIIGLAFILLGCNISTENFPEPNQLREKIASSINIPFSKSDIAIYNSSQFVCGNNSNEAINRTYKPQLRDAPYFDIIKNNFEGYILSSEEIQSQNGQKECVENGKIVYKCFVKNKILFNVSGWAESNTSVSIYEKYYLNNEQYSVEKYFEFKNGGWEFHIVDQSKNVLLPKK